MRGGRTWGFDCIILVYQIHAFRTSFGLKLFITHTF